MKKYLNPLLLFFIALFFYIPPVLGAPTAYTGKGITIAVMDTGADIYHPDLKNNIIGGYDFVENKPIYKDGDHRKGHGTHVAGIISANGSLQGIAPDASLLIYRVVSENDSDTDKNLIKAVYQAIKDGADIINISMRSNDVDPNGPLNTAIQAALKEDILVVKAAGNYGPEDYSVFGLAASESVITVGHSTFPTLMPTLTLLDHTTLTLQPLSFSPAFTEGNSLELIKKEEGIPLENVQNKWVAFEHSNNILEILSLLEEFSQKKAAAALMITDSPYSLRLNQNGELLPLPVASISSQDYERLKQSKTFDVSLSTKQLISMDSSHGPAYGNFVLKPDLIDPGVDVLSTVPTQINASSYGYNSGTSMASPYVAGAAALVMEAHPTWSAKEVKSALINTSITASDLTNLPYPTTVQGAGTISLKHALNASIAFEQVSLSAYVSDEQLLKNPLYIEDSLTVTNLTDKPRSYTITVQPDNGTSKDVISVVDHLSIAPYGQVTLSITFHTQIGRHAGRLIFTPKEESENLYTVPYLFTSSLDDFPLIREISLEHNWLSLTQPSTVFSFYLPTQMDKVSILLENSRSKDIPPLIIYEDFNLLAGTHHVNFDSGQPIVSSTSNTFIEDGIYNISCIAEKNQHQKVISGSVLIVDRTPPEAQIKDNGHTISIQVQDFMLDSPHIAEKSGLQPVTAKWQPKGSNDWYVVPLDSTGSLTLSRETVGNRPLLIQLTDAYGNHSLWSIPTPLLD